MYINIYINKGISIIPFAQLDKGSAKFLSFSKSYYF